MNIKLASESLTSCSESHICYLGTNYVELVAIFYTLVYVWSGMVLWAELTGGRAEVEEVGHPLGFNCKFF